MQKAELHIKMHAKEIINGGSRHIYIRLAPADGDRRCSGF